MAAWTVIHYAAGDNNLEKVLVEDINEMELGHRGFPNVNVLTQLDRNSEPGVWRYAIAPDNSHGSEITIDKLARALASISATARQPSDPEWRNRLVIYGSDACLMQSVEVIYD